jgi:two-component system KDP operon response regulator KdpE
MKKHLILVVDDEPRILRLIQTNLKLAGYSVLCAGDGPSGLEIVERENPDLVILDILLVGPFDGYAVCERIREFSDVPVLMLTAKSQDADKIRGFDAGADDYLTKPFSSQELLARVKAILRRSGEGSKVKGPSTLACGEISINFAQARVTTEHAGTVDLTPTEFKILSELAKHPNEIVLHEDLLTRVWGSEYRNEVDYLRAYIWYLRRKLERDPSRPRYLLSRQGLGYMLVCPGDPESAQEQGDPGEPPG